MGLQSFEEQNLLARMADISNDSNRTKAESSSGANKLPLGKIKDLEISRIICGGNLIGGWAHSRDLMYVSTLVKA